LIKREKRVSEELPEGYVLRLQNFFANAKLGLPIH